MVSTVDHPTIRKEQIRVADTQPDETQVDRKSMQLINVSPGDSMKQSSTTITTTTTTPLAVFREDSLPTKGDNNSIVVVAHPSSPEVTEEDSKIHGQRCDDNNMKVVDANPRKMEGRVSDGNGIDKTTTNSALQSKPKEKEQNSISPIVHSPNIRGGDVSLTMKLSSRGEGGTHPNINISSMDVNDTTQESIDPTCTKTVPSSLSSSSTKNQHWDKTKPYPTTNIPTPGINDCLMGRGGGTNHHPGNKRFRAMTESKKPKYLASKRLDKPIVAMEIIHEWRMLDPPGRFLKQDGRTKLWYDVGDQKAREKTSQALREKIAYSMVGEEGVVVEQSTGVKELDPEDKKGIWTETEMNLVREAQRELGNKWSEVAKRVPGRSENSVKNWWYNHQTSEKRKRKRQDKTSATRLPPAKKFHHALIPSTYQGEQTNKAYSHGANSWTMTTTSSPHHGVVEETSPRTVVIDTVPGTTSSNSTTIIVGDDAVATTNDYISFESSSSEEVSVVCEFGDIGYTFSRRLESENGEDLGWYVGNVVDILKGREKDRKCLYFAIGFIEELSLADLTELAQLESKRPF